MSIHLQYLFSHLGAADTFSTPLLIGLNPKDGQTFSNVLLQQQEEQNKRHLCISTNACMYVCVLKH